MAQRLSPPRIHPPTKLSRQSGSEPLLCCTWACWGYLQIGKSKLDAFSCFDFVRTPVLAETIRSLGLMQKHGSSGIAHELDRSFSFHHVGTLQCALFTFVCGFTWREPKLAGTPKFGCVRFTVVHCVSGSALTSCWYISLGQEPVCRCSISVTTYQRHDYKPKL